MQLADWRKREKLTGVEAAEKLGLSQATISRIESGQHWPDSKTIEKIRVGTDGAVTPTDFLPLDGSEAAA